MGVKVTRVTRNPTVCSTACSDWQQIKYRSSALPDFYEGDPLMAGGFPAQKASNAESDSIPWHHRALLIKPVSLVTPYKNNTFVKISVIKQFVPGSDAGLYFILLQVVFGCYCCPVNKKTSLKMNVLNAVIKMVEMIYTPDMSFHSISFDSAVIYNLEVISI